MRDRMLHDSLRALTGDAARLLDDQLASGAEIPFEVGESTTAEPQDGQRGQSNATMFAYRPLTAEFVGSSADRLRALPTFENAAQNLVRTPGILAYLRVRDEPVLDVGELTHARLAALAFLASVWNDAERFDEWGERFERAYAELEAVALADRLVTTVFVPVHGVVVDGESVNLGAGVELISAEDLDPDCAERFSDAVAGADSFCSISVDAPSDSPTPMPEVRVVARSVLTALRLFKPGGVALAMTAQADVGGAWHQVSMPFSGRARHAAWHIERGEDEELRQFLNAVRRIERRTRISWALKRFEMGLERGVPAEGLTDFLTALGALLEVRDETGKAAMPARISALCARDDERREVRATIEAAFALERLALDGSVGRSDRKRLAKQPPLEVIGDTERHLRALLHDLVCGYLSTDLRALADEILSADGEPVGDDDLVPEPVYLEPVPEPGAAPTPDPTATVEFDAVFDDTAEISVVDAREGEAEGTAAAVDPPADEDNVWTLRPAPEVQAPPTTPEPDAAMRERAESVVEDFGAAFDASLGEPATDSEVANLHETPTDEATPPADATAAGVPVWEENPERRPVEGRPAASAKSDQPSEESAAGFTFDFKKLDREPQPKPQQPAAENPAQEFPIPEFGLPIGPGPAASDTDESVDGPAQRERFSRIMDENFTPPPTPNGDRATTPIARNSAPHLRGLDSDHAQIGAEADAGPAAPRIVHPEIFGADSEDSPPVDESQPPDPQATVEYDALSAETSAEEAAQLAWSEQFLPRGAEPAATKNPPPAESPTGDAQLRLVERPGDDPVSPEPAAESKDEDSTSKAAPSSENARTQSIGPATIEFRPVVDPDKDDPDDFAGAC